MFPSMAFQQPMRSATPIVRHNFKSIDDLLSPLPNSLTSTPSQRNGKAAIQNSLFQSDAGKSTGVLHSSLGSYRMPSLEHSFCHLDDTGYNSSQYLSGSLLSLRQSRESIDSHEHEEDLENIKPTCASSPIPTNTKSQLDSVSSSRC